MITGWRASLLVCVKNVRWFAFTHRATALLLAAMTLALAAIPVGNRLLDAKETADANAVTGGSTNAFRAGAIVPINPATLKTFHFKAATDTKDIEETCYYSDKYFLTPATDYYPSLCTATMCLAMSAFASSDAVLVEKNYATQARNVEAFMRDADKLGLTDVAVNDAFQKQPETGTIGVAIGYKNLPFGAKPLIVVAVRGYNYEREWSSNFLIGRLGDHAGFDNASDQVIAFIKDYVGRHPALQNTDVKFWITGFSRAAATSNLTGAKLDDAMTDLGSTLGLIDTRVAKEDLYVYTFETPAGRVIPEAHHDGRYDNIFNIINPHDLVPMVAPDTLPGSGNELGFGHYGVNMYLPGKENHADYTALQAAMLARYRRKQTDPQYTKYKDSGYAPEYKLETFVPYKVIWEQGGYILKEMPNGLTSRGLYYYEFVRDLAQQQLTSRAHYVDSGLMKSIQTAVVFFMHGMSTMPNLIKILFLVAFGAKVVNNLGTVWDLLSRSEYAKLAKLLKGYLVDALKAVQRPDLATAAEGVTDFLINIIKTNPNYFFTLFQNRVGMMQGHAPELCLSWLEAMDKNYVATPTDAEKAFLSGEYRIVSVTGDVKATCARAVSSGGATVYEPLASVESGVVTSSTGAILAGQDLDEETIFVLPVNGAYRLSITSPGKDAAFTYTVTECNPKVLTRDKRFVFYAQKPIGGTETVTGAVPAFTDAEAKSGLPNGSGYAYTLTGANGAYTPDGDYDAAQINSHYTRIALQEKNGDYGHAYGAGVQLVGTKALVTALPSTDGVFVEWRDAAGRALTTENEYRFYIDKNAGASTINLTAVFAKKPDVPEPGDGTDVPHTGDDAPIWLLLGVLVAAGCGFALCRACKKRRKDQE